MRSNLSSSQREKEERGGGRAEAERRGKKGRVEGREGRRRETAQ